MRLVRGRLACPIVDAMNDRVGSGLRAHFDVKKKEPEIAMRKMGRGSYSDEGKHPLVSCSMTTFVVLA